MAIIGEFYIPHQPSLRGDLLGLKIQRIFKVYKRICKITKAEIFLNNEIKSSRPTNDTLADSDEYHSVEHKRRDPDHVFLRLLCSAVLSINNIHIFLLGLEEDKTCLKTI